ncbi:hypothetical protein BS47DRAFT_1402160 [Hydnum rufescens UP504]|uniref:Uncharacterized protein n=1 Tax=Hydnum rufescens UP504 TaxID=1448309 RepID=A0A9P6ADH3_9AGAM|nr:hypothetical protein BS47DRAFT_1402160 [Hydnum rufescens UP504]
MEACKANHCNHVKSIRINYYDKCELDIEDIMKILSLLHCTLDSHEFEITAMIDAAAALTCQTHSLDEQFDLYAKAMAGQGQSQVDKFSWIFTLAADIVSQEETSSNPFFAFKLHRRFTPHLLGLAWAIAQPHSSISAFTPDSESIVCYSRVVQGLQLKLYDHEWSELKDDINKYEYADLLWPKWSRNFVVTRHWSMRMMDGKLSISLSCKSPHPSSFLPPSFSAELFSHSPPNSRVAFFFYKDHDLKLSCMTTSILG